MGRETLICYFIPKKAPLSSNNILSFKTFPIMKKVFLIFLGALVFASCNNKSSDSTEVPTDSSAMAPTAEKMNYPYTIDHPDYWNIGSPENTMVALSALKAYENGNIPETMKYFGDSIHLQFDDLDQTLPADSVQAMFTNFRNAHKTYTIKMED